MMTDNNTLLEAGKFAVKGARWLWLLNELNDDAEKLTIWGDVQNMRHVVVSAHIQALLRAYRVASSPRMILCYSPSGSGKTIAAEFLMYGKHALRPKRALLIQCSGMRDFPSAFAVQINAPRDAVPFMHTILIEALLPSAKKTPLSLPLSLNMGGKWTAMMDSLKRFQCNNPSLPKTRLVNEIELAPNEQLPQQQIAGFKNFPLLILDDFGVDTVENRLFVDQLHTAAFNRNVMVIVLNKDEAWATTMFNINGGSKIVPLVENVTNIWIPTLRLKEPPVWNEMNWTVESLQNVVKLNNKDFDFPDFDFLNGSMTALEALQTAAEYRYRPPT
jgi:hypothetical protein